MDSSVRIWSHLLRPLCYFLRCEILPRSHRRTKPACSAVKLYLFCSLRPLPPAPFPVLWQDGKMLFPWLQKMRHFLLWAEVVLLHSWIIRCLLLLGSLAPNNEGITNPRNTSTRQQYNGCTPLSQVETADFSHYRAIVLMSSCKSTLRKWITHRVEKLHLGTFELRCNESTAKRCHLLTLQGSLSRFLSALCDAEMVQPCGLGPACLILRRSSVASPMSWQRCPIFSMSSPVRTDCSSTLLKTARGAREQQFAWSFMAHTVLAWTMTCHSAGIHNARDFICVCSFWIQ